MSNSLSITDLEPSPVTLFFQVHATGTIDDENSSYMRKI